MGEKRGGQVGGFRRSSRKEGEGRLSEKQRAAKPKAKTFQTRNADPQCYVTPPAWPCTQGTLASRASLGSEFEDPSRIPWDAGLSRGRWPRGHGENKKKPQSGTRGREESDGCLLWRRWVWVWSEAAIEGSPARQQEPSPGFHCCPVSPSERVRRYGPFLPLLGCSGCRAGGGSAQSLPPFVALGPPSGTRTDEATGPYCSHGDCSVGASRPWGNSPDGAPLPGGQLRIRTSPSWTRVAKSSTLAKPGAGQHEVDKLFYQNSSSALLGLEAKMKKILPASSI